MTEAITSSSRFGWTAVLLGFLSFAAVVGHFFIGPIDPPPPIEVSIAEKAVNIRDATVAALKGEDYEVEATSPPRTVDDYLTYGFLGLALVAMFLAVVGFIRKESWRPAFAGAAFGAMAITFQFAIVVFFAILFAIILGSVLDKLDFDFG